MQTFNDNNIPKLNVDFIK